MGVAAAVAPTKAYSFLGGILRKRPEIICPVATINTPYIATEWKWWINGLGPFGPDDTAHLPNDTSAFIRQVGPYSEIVYVTSNVSSDAKFETTIDWMEAV